MKNIGPAAKQDPSKWAQVQDDLAKLAAMHTNAEPEPYPTYGDMRGKRVVARS